LADDNSNEVDFVVKTNKNNVILVESKYNNLKEGVLNSLNNVFLNDIHSKNITKRIVITNKVNSIQTLENINIQLISLEEFLVNGFYSSDIVLSKEAEKRYLKMADDIEKNKNIHKSSNIDDLI